MNIAAPYINWRQEARDYLFIFIGILCYITGFICFQLPYFITTGGLAGVTAIINFATGIPVQIPYMIINGILLLMAMRILGWKFCLRTGIVILAMTMLMKVEQDIITHASWAQPYIDPSIGPLPRLLGDQQFMSCVIGAMLEGIGLGIVFLNNGSTGGTDIIALVVNKYRDITLGQMLMLLDVFIISTSLLTPKGDVQRLLMGYCTLLIANLTLDFVLDRGRQSVQFFIISRYFDKIASTINETGRGVTVLDGHGWYTGNTQKVLMVLAKRSESPTIFRIIHNIDPNAFVSQSKVIGVFGEGFDKMKVRKAKANVTRPKIDSEQSAALRNSVNLTSTTDYEATVGSSAGAEA